MNRKKQYQIRIESSRETVWDVLWGDTYSEWTRVFSAGSRVETDWREGSEVLFLDGTGRGMYSRIERKVEPSLMVFKHLGETAGGTRTPFSAESGWAGALEEYRLSNEGGETLLVVELDVDENFEDFMDEKFPQALSIVRKLAESRSEDRAGSSRT